MMDNKVIFHIEVTKQRKDKRVIFVPLPFSIVKQLLFKFHSSAGRFTVNGIAIRGTIFL